MHTFLDLVTLQGNQITASKFHFKRLKIDILNPAQATTI